MEKSDDNDKGKKKVEKVTTFPVPFALKKIKENICITLNTAAEPSKEDIINQAFKFHSEGKILEAAKYYQHFINQGFTDHRVFSNYGILLKNLGKLQEAENSYRKAIEIEPDLTEAHYNLGIILNDLGKLQEAENSYRKAIEIKPDLAEAYSNLGNVLINLGKLQDAELSYRKAIELKPGFAEAHYNLGIILKDLGKLQEAEISYRKAVELKPDYAEAYSNLGIILKDLGKLQEAEISYRKAVELKPDYAEAYSNLGIILKDLGKLQEAEISYRKAVELKPDYAEAHSNLGNVLKDLGKLQEAEISYRKAVELKPDYAEAYSNLGIILKDLGKLQEAEISYRKAIELKPDYAEAYCNLSMIELLKGDYQSGLENYEFRFKKKIPAILHGNTKLKRVDNQEFQKGTKLLVLSEQGLGDTLQYMRYIPYLRSQGLDVSFCAQEKLHTLIKASGIDNNPLTPEKANLVSEGQWIPLLSLPRYLQVTPINPIINKPYIYSTSEFKAKWKKIISQDKKTIVGINWQGNPNLEKTYQGRSIPLEVFSVLAENDKITLLSLQKGYGSEQLNDCSFKNKFIECQPQIDVTWDFHENAAIIDNCELIITCDTSIAHLAGGMGKKVWLLLKNIPYWTWGTEGESTFWYPSMRLFRQKEEHNWNAVMEVLSSELKNKIETKN